MKLLILDGNSVIKRAFFGVKPLTTREGLYTHAIYGFLLQHFQFRHLLFQNQKTHYQLMC